MRIKCLEKTNVDVWGQSRDPRYLPRLTIAGTGVAGVLQIWLKLKLEARELLDSLKSLAHLTQTCMFNESR